MKVDDTAQVRRELDAAVQERSESDERNYVLSDLIRRGSGIVDFSNCETFRKAPFDRCRTDMDRRRMFASMLAAASSMHMDHLTPEAFAEHSSNIDELYRQMREYHADVMEKDPFISTISLPLGEKDGFVFGFSSRKKGQLFHYDGPVEHGYEDIPRLGYFDEDVRFPTISRNGRIMVSLEPGYFETMRRHEAIASGDILCLGLKTGYFALSASAKENVRTVTIVEDDPQVISLFEDVMIPQFPHAEKIAVLNEDPAAFMKKEWKREYRYAFVSCYPDPMCGAESYFQIKQMEKRHRKTKFSYWLEESILANVKSAVLAGLVAARQEDHEKLYKSLAGDEQGEQLFETVRPLLDHLEVHSARDIRMLFDNHRLARRIGGLTDQA